jgi:outer membrane protein assembly factor BamB
MWGFAAHPLLDGRKLIGLAGGKGSLVVALDRDTGREIWRALDAKEPGYCPPMIYELGGRRQLIVWHPESVNSLDPETGRLLWTVPWTIKAGLTISTPRTWGNRLFLTAFYDGSMMLEVEPAESAARPLWRSRKSSERDTTELHSIMSTPFLDQDHIYGVCSYGQLRCLKAATGERVWETLAATTGQQEARWANAFLIPQAGRCFLFNEKGELIIARLTPRGYGEISRAFLIEPTNTAAGRKVLWSHPAFANRSLYVRNDREIACFSLAAP